MRMVDVKCPKCETVRIDVLLRERNEAGEYIYPPCEALVVDQHAEVEGVPVFETTPHRCGATTERVHLGTSAGVVDDSIPGGLYIENALCHSDGTPRRFDSRTELRRAEKAAGYTNYVVHQGGKGSDRSKHTQRFV